MAGLCSAWFARGLSLNKPARYPQILGAVWLLLNVLPAFTAIDSFDRYSHAWHPATISPITMLIAYADGHASTPPNIAIAFYLGLFLVGQALHIRFNRKKKKRAG